MRQRYPWLVKILMGIVISGIFASLFSSAIQAALTLPPSANASGIVPVTVTVKPVMTPTGKPVIPTVVVTPSPTAHDETDVVEVVAQDNFKRKDQTKWGKAADGQQWGADASKLDAFGIVGNSGQVDALQLISAFPVPVAAVIGPVEEHVNVLMNGSLSKYESGATLGVVLRWSNSDNWYSAVLDGKRLVIQKRVNGKTSEVRAVSFVAKDTVAYNIRFQAVGALLFAKVWASDVSEPKNWMVTASDSAFSKGQVGVRADLHFNTVAKYTFFHAQTATLRSFD